MICGRDSKHGDNNKKLLSQNMVMILMNSINVIRKGFKRNTRTIRIISQMHTRLSKGIWQMGEKPGLKCNRISQNRE